MSRITSLLRLAVQSDLENLAALVSAYHAFDHLDFDEELVRRLLIQIIQDESIGRLWLIEHEGSCAGYILLTFGFSIEFKGRDAFIDEFYLQPTFRGSGLGSAALSAVQEEANKLGINAIHLEVERKNESAYNLYQRLGFEDHDRTMMTLNASPEVP